MWPSALLQPAACAAITRNRLYRFGSSGQPLATSRPCQGRAADSAPDRKRGQRVAHRSVGTLHRSRGGAPRDRSRSDARGAFCSLRFRSFGRSTRFRPMSFDSRRLPCAACWSELDIKTRSSKRRAVAVPCWHSRLGCGFGAVRSPRVLMSLTRAMLSILLWPVIWLLLWTSARMSLRRAQ